MSDSILFFTLDVVEPYYFIDSVYPNDVSGRGKEPRVC